MAKLVPPIPFDHFRLFDFVEGPQVLLLLVQKDCLIYRLIAPRFLLIRGLELVLIVTAIEGHFNQAGVGLISIGVVHWLVGAASSRLTLGECDLFLLIIALGFRAEVWFKVGFVVFLEVILVCVRNGEVVVEGCTAENEPFTPGRRFSEYGQGIIGKNAEDNIIEGFLCGLLGL